MHNIRLIARLDIKGQNVIKGVHLEGLRVVGDPQALAIRYYEAGVDELLYMDVVASLYNRNSLSEIIKRAAQDVFVPITVGGGIRSVDDAKHILRCGADKVAVNTAAVARPQLISDLARRFGSQAVVLSIEAKQVGPNRWEAYTNNGREKTGLDVVEWAGRGVSLGAGEILVTSIDREGTRRGFDLALMSAVNTVVPVPMIASGGMGSTEHLVEVVQQASVDAVGMAHVLHYKTLELDQLRRSVRQLGIRTRQPS